MSRGAVMPRKEVKHLSVGALQSDESSISFGVAKSHQTPCRESREPGPHNSMQQAPQQRCNVKGKGGDGSDRYKTGLAGCRVAEVGDDAVAGAVCAEYHEWLELLRRERMPEADRRQVARQIWDEWLEVLTVALGGEAKDARISAARERMRDRQWTAVSATFEADYIGRRVRRKLELEAAGRCAE